MMSMLCIQSFCLVWYSEMNRAFVMDMIHLHNVAKSESDANITVFYISDEGIDFDSGYSFALIYI